MQIEATIFGGLPVLAEVVEYPAEPDVGIMRPYGEVEAIYLMRVRKRDHKVILRSIPRSWWPRISDAELEDIALQAVSDC